MGPAARLSPGSATLLYSPCHARPVVQAAQCELGCGLPSLEPWTGSGLLAPLERTNPQLPPSCVLWAAAQACASRGTDAKATEHHVLYETPSATHVLHTLPQRLLSLSTDPAVAGAPLETLVGRHQAHPQSHPCRSTAAARQAHTIRTTRKQRSVRRWAREQAAARAQVGKGNLS